MVHQYKYESTQLFILLLLFRLNGQTPSCSTCNSWKPGMDILDEGLFTKKTIKIIISRQMKPDGANELTVYKE